MKPKSKSISVVSLHHQLTKHLFSEYSLNIQDYQQNRAF